MRKSILLGLAVALLAAPGAAAKIVGDRYVAPDGAFSIAMAATADKEFKLDKEGGNADLVVVDFQYAMAQAHEGFAQRTVEWIKLEAPVDPAQYDAHASATASGYLEGRFAGVAFTMTDRRKLRTESGQLVYTFAATGTVNGTPSLWHGALLFFDSGVALVSQLHTAATQPMLDADGITDAELTTWASTVRPEK